MIEDAVADAELGTRRWFLAPLGDNREHDDELLWIHIRGALNNVGDTIEHMGTQLSSYPSLRCHVFSRSACPSKDLVKQIWSRVNNLKGQTMFLGINYPFFVGSPGAVEHVIAQATLAPDDAAAAGGVGGVGGAGADEELAAAAPGEADEILGDCCW